VGFGLEPIRLDLLGITRLDAAPLSLSQRRPNAATMNGSRRDIRPDMNSTSRDSRSSLAATIEHLRRLASASAR